MPGDLIWYRNRLYFVPPYKSSSNEDCKPLYNELSEDDGSRSGCRLLGHSAVLNTPRWIWSRSMDSNSALKLPSPKPLSPLR